ncbi:MAG: L-fucose:H+ symporter permease [Muribaculaceae bacterium]|nr:L-fucose:H+ symporter permease [Muribaculaceae bacterium]
MKPNRLGNTINNRIPFILVSLLFLLWGVANNMNDTLLAAFRRIMSMSDLQTSLVQFAFFGAYFCFALPAALFIRRHSYKAGILLGLAVYAAGTMLFYPAGLTASYGFYLFAIYIMAGGCAVLETTANPYILSMGSPQTATRRLNIAQTLNPVGAICGILLSRHFILSELHASDAAERAGMGADALAAIQRHELDAVSGTYMLIGFILLALLAVIAFVRMPGEKDSGSLDMTSTFGRLWRNRRWRYGVVAQFFYVGVQTGVWSFTIRLAMDRLGMVEKDASMIFLYSIVAFTGFRFLFTWLMAYVKPVLLLAGAAIAAIACTMGVIFGEGWFSVWALVAISAFMSLMFPTIYGLAIDVIGREDSKLAASALIMAILGGALLTPLQAYVSDTHGIGCSFWVPAACFAVVLAYSAGIILKRNNAPVPEID